jgi:hypothetical protein
LKDVAPEFVPLPQPKLQSAEKMNNRLRASENGDRAVAMDFRDISASLRDHEPASNRIETGESAAAGYRSERLRVQRFVPQFGKQLTEI